MMGVQRMHKGEVRPDGLLLLLSLLAGCYPATFLAHLPLLPENHSATILDVIVI